MEATFLTPFNRPMAVKNAFFLVSLCHTWKLCRNKLIVFAFSQKHYFEKLNDGNRIGEIPELVVRVLTKLLKKGNAIAGEFDFTK